MVIKCKRKLKPKSYFDPKSFRWKIVSDKARVLIGCKRGKWKRGRCSVGTEVYEVVKMSKGKRCPARYKRT